MKSELRMERMNLFDHKEESSETLFRGNDKTFDETPGE